MSKKNLSSVNSLTFTENYSESNISDTISNNKILEKSVLKNEENSIKEKENLTNKSSSKKSVKHSKSSSSFLDQEEILKSKIKNKKDYKNRKKSIKNNKSITKKINLTKEISTNKKKTTNKNIYNAIKKYKNEYYLANNIYSFRREPFKRLVNSIKDDINKNHLHFSKNSLEIIQGQAENYIIRLIEDSYLCTLHRNRVTLMEVDIRLARRIRFNNGIGFN